MTACPANLAPPTEFDRWLGAEPDLRDLMDPSTLNFVLGCCECGAATYAIWEGSLSVGANETYSAI